MEKSRYCPKCGTENRWIKRYYGSVFPQYTRGLCCGEDRSVCCEKCAYNFDTREIDIRMLEKAKNFENRLRLKRIIQ
jgi:uncharacterized protein YhbP (UPF0306 family)